MTTIAEAIDAIYDAKAGKFRKEFVDSLERVTADNLPKDGDLVFSHTEGYDNEGALRRTIGDFNFVPSHPYYIVRRFARPEPYLIYFPWPSGIDGIIGVIGPRGNISGLAEYRRFFYDGSWAKPCRQRTELHQIEDGICRFPADADLKWVRSEDEVPEDLLKEARERA